MPSTAKDLLLHTNALLRCLDECTDARHSQPRNSISELCERLRSDVTALRRLLSTSEWEDEADMQQQVRLYYDIRENSAEIPDSTIFTPLWARNSASNPVRIQSAP